MHPGDKMHVLRHHHGKIKSFPKDDPAKKPHFTAFMSYKAGMTHIVREVDRPGSKLNKKERLGIFYSPVFLRTFQYISGLLGDKEVGYA